MEYIAFYKYNYRRYNSLGEPITDELEFNYFDHGHADENGFKIKCIDSIKVTDLLAEVMTGIDWGIRKEDDIKKLDMGRFSLEFDMENSQKSKLGKTLDEFFATSELNTRQIYCVCQYGPELVYEGWVDKPSIYRDYTWTEKKWQLTMEVDGPAGKLFESMRNFNVQKVPVNSSVPFIEYFREYHFVKYFNNGSITTYTDRINFSDRLQNDVTVCVSSPLQRSILFSDMSIFDATKSFALGLGFVFELKSIRPWGYEELHMLPFEMTISIEGDAANEVTVDDIEVHKQGYSWNSNQHFILPYWKLSGNPAQTEAYYFGLFMSVQSNYTANFDYPFGSNIVRPIKLFNAGARKGYYEITGAGFNAKKDDTYLMDVEYREQGLFTHNVEGQNFGIGLAYFRILVTSWTINPTSQQYSDTGFADIVNVTALNVYRYMCGQLKEKRFITIPYPPETTIKPGSVLNSTQFAGSCKVERIKKIDAKKQNADCEVIQN